MPGLAFLRRDVRVERIEHESADLFRLHHVGGAQHAQVVRDVDDFRADGVGQRADVPWLDFAQPKQRVGLQRAGDQVRGGWRGDPRSVSGPTGWAVP